MNFDHWKEALAEETPAPDFHRAYVRAATDPRARKRVVAIRGVGASAFVAPADDLSLSPSPRPSPTGRGGNDSRLSPTRTRSLVKARTPRLPLPEGEGRGEGGRWVQSVGMNGTSSRPAVLIPKAPGHSATPSVADARSAFIPPRPGVLVRVQSLEEEIA